MHVLLYIIWDIGNDLPNSLNKLCFEILTSRYSLGLF